MKIKTWGNKNIKQKKQNDKNLVEKGSKILICKEKWEKLVNRKYEVKQNKILKITGICEMD